MLILYCISSIQSMFAQRLLVPTVQVIGKVVLVLCYNVKPIRFSTLLSKKLTISYRLIIKCKKTLLAAIDPVGNIQQDPIRATQ